MSDNCDHNFGTFGDFGVKKTKPVGSREVWQKCLHQVAHPKVFRAQHMCLCNIWFNSQKLKTESLYFSW